MPETFTIIPLDACDCFTMTVRGGHRHQQIAYTPLDHKPAGDGWQYPPGVDRAGYRLRWVRDIAPSAAAAS